MSTKHTPIHDSLSGIGKGLLTDDEYDSLGRVADAIIKQASHGLVSPGPDFDRIYGKGYRNGYVAALAQYPDLARELIAKGTKYPTHP